MVGGPAGQGNCLEFGGVDVVCSKQQVDGGEVVLCPPARAYLYQFLERVRNQQSCQSDGCPVTDFIFIFIFIFLISFYRPRGRAHDGRLAVGT